MLLKAYFGCIQLGNLDLDLKIHFGFAIECQIQKRILMHLFLKSEKGFEKLSLRTEVLHKHT